MMIRYDVALLKWLMWLFPSGNDPGFKCIHLIPSPHDALHDLWLFQSINRNWRFCYFALVWTSTRSITQNCLPKETCGNETFWWKHGLSFTSGGKTEREISRQ